MFGCSEWGKGVAKRPGMWVRDPSHGHTMHIIHAGWGISKHRSQGVGVSLEGFGHLRAHSRAMRGRLFATTRSHMRRIKLIRGCEAPASYLGYNNEDIVYKLVVQVNQVSKVQKGY